MSRAFRDLGDLHTTIARNPAGLFDIGNPSE